ncbi:MAG: M20 family metallo-hydrolase [Akkermansiaceae bacterium]|nr:M20 family metallo-hydrolase [Akkermansiaceae bacterium]MDP4847548.1 M20 family metallo-hydrolase [Akkermansiaceae bacterium]MDP4995847.1 M20 family metallo-hydrolase [Akkermansiaceae bacterium]
MEVEVLKRVLARVDELGGISDSAEYLQRTFLSTANREAGERVMGWMRELGMDAAHDAGGTVRGFLAGSAEGKAVLIGSHIDTVINGGKYDGALGVIAALGALEQLKVEGVELPFPVHVLGFSDEEGVRFQSTYLGSAGVIGALDAGMLAVKDEGGLTVEEVISQEGWHECAEVFSYDETNAAGYLELHIEQGRVLEEAGESVAVVSGIFAQARLRVSVEGLADHAGTTPMNLRRDALAGAAECVLAAEGFARENDGMVATVGVMKVLPGASNGIAQTCNFTLDVRCAENDLLESGLGVLKGRFAEISKSRELELKWEVVQVNGAVPCDEGMVADLVKSAEKVTGTARVLGSGAGHDGVMMSRVMPVGMIFVRCRAGLSHHPDEFAEAGDIEAGIDVMVEFLKRRVQ